MFLRYLISGIVLLSTNLAVASGDDKGIIQSPFTIPKALSAPAALSCLLPNILEQPDESEKKLLNKRTNALPVKKKRSQTMFDSKDQNASAEWTLTEWQEWWEKYIEDGLPGFKPGSVPGTKTRVPPKEFASLY